MTEQMILQEPRVLQETRDLLAQMEALDQTDLRARLIGREDWALKGLQSLRGLLDLEEPTVHREQMELDERR